MNLQILSDLHESPYTLNPLADLIVSAGDFSNGLRGVFNFVQHCESLNKDYVITLGNHDFYNLSIQETYDILDANNINYLKEGKEYHYKGYCFVGGTLFSNFRANVDSKKQVKQHKILASKNIADFYTIYKKNMNEQRYRLSLIMQGQQKEGFKITPDEYVKLFNKQWNWIQQYKDKPNTIVVTHFPPHLVCLDTYWSNHPTASSLNPYFVNDLDIKGFKLWVAGHVHTALDKEIDGCRIVVNPLGYPSEHGVNGFIMDKIIELPTLEY